MINLVANNHLSQTQIQDFLEYLFLAITSTGVQASYGLGDWTVEGANIVLEGCTPDFTSKMIAAKQAYPSLKIFMVVTEFVKDGQLNSANVDFSDSNEPDNLYVDKENWLQRTAQLTRMLPYLDGLICLNSLLLKQYKEIHRNCFYLPLFKLNQLVRCKPLSPKKYDFVFSGTITQYRKLMIDALISRGIKVILLSSTTPEYTRNTIYAQSRAVLGPRLCEHTITFSNMRAYYCLINRLPHIFEPVKNPCDMARFVNFADQGDFFERVIYFHENFNKQKYMFDDFDAFSIENRKTFFKNFTNWLRS